MKKAIALAMASVMAAGLLAGCGGSAANSTAASSEAASSEAASTSTEAATEAHTVNTTDPITLTISWWGGDARQAAYEAACKAFTEKYPNITVECTYGPWNGWEEAQSTALAAGTAADVMQVNWNWLFQYSGKGQSFANLNDYSDVLDLTQFPSNALDACTVAGSLQAVPVAMTGRIYYWNMATFKKAGLDHYPTTEQELLDAAKTFQEKLGDDYYPLAAGPLDRMIMMTFYLESKYGEPWVTDSTLNYTVEQLQEGLEWIQSLEDNHVMPDLKTMNAAGDKTITDGQAWITGKYAGIFTWDSSALSASQNLPDDAERITILADSEEAGVYLCMAQDGRQIFVMGHPEYDRMTLDSEYKRDMGKGLNPQIPENYYPNDDPEKKPMLTWRAHCNNLYTNWLNYYVYQVTPYDLYGTPF